MACPYGEEMLQKWDSEANPIGSYCDECYECECEHWAGHCVGCDMPATSSCLRPFLEDDCAPD